MLKLIQELKEREISGTISSTVAVGLEKIQKNGQGLFRLKVMLDGEGDRTNRSYRGGQWAYRIEKLSNADISDFSVYRRVYRIKPPISSILIFSKPVIFLSFFAENSENSSKIPKNP